MIIDTHCHYNLEPLYANWQTYLEQAQSRGINRSIVVGTRLESTRLAIQLTSQAEAFYAAVGIHPNEYDSMAKEEIEQTVADQIRELHESCSQPKVVAIGETGLDYFRLPTEASQAETVRQAQQAGFIAHIQLANETGLPLIIHVRDQVVSETKITHNAYWDCLDLLQQHYTGHQPFILHCVSGPLSYIQKAVELGAYIGVAGNVTYKSADHIRSLVKIAPQNRLLLETDAPFLPPHPFRGQMCQPSMIADTAAFVEEELGLKSEIFYQNTLSLFPQLSLT